jgi:aspartate kinase
MAKTTTKTTKKKRLVVQKYGGTSVGSPERIKNVAARIKRYVKKGDDVVVVASAMSGETDRLIGLAQQVQVVPNERELDMLLATGEQASCALLAMAIQDAGMDSISLNGPQVGIKTDTFHSKAKIMEIDGKRIKKELGAGRVVIVTGFQGMTPDADITTLGRGGSDLSAVAIAAAIKADVCEIYTDVNGIYTADPRIVPEAKKLDTIDFDEILELAARGAKVMHSRSIEVAKKYNIPLHVRSSFNDEEGTIIMNTQAKKNRIEESVVRGVALTEKEVKITIASVPDKPGFAAKIFDELSKANVGVDMIVQNVSLDKRTDISFTVEKTDMHKAVKTTEKVAKDIGAKTVIVDEDIAKVSVVGIGMRSHSGVAAKCFSALADNKINIEMISTSEISISCVIEKAAGKKSLQILHKAFGLEK